MSDQPQREANASHETPAKQRPDAPRETGKTSNRKSAVYLYLLILFGAAFLMLLLAYFVQQRNNEAAIDGLQNSWNLSREQLVESIEQLNAEKEALEGRAAELEEQLRQEEEHSAEFQSLYDGARNSASHLEYCLHKQGEAMELFWQLDRAYIQGRNQTCRELMALMEAPEADPLKNYLPSSSDRDRYDNGGYLDGWTSPAQRYQEIAEKLP